MAFQDVTSSLSASLIFSSFKASSFASSAAFFATSSAFLISSFWASISSFVGPLPNTSFIFSCPEVSLDFFLLFLINFESRSTLFFLSFRMGHRGWKSGGDGGDSCGSGGAFLSEGPRLAPGRHKRYAGDKLPVTTDDPLPAPPAIAAAGTGRWSCTCGEISPGCGWSTPSSKTSIGVTCKMP